MTFVKDDNTLVYTGPFRSCWDYLLRNKYTQEFPSTDLPIFIRGNEIVERVEIMENLEPDMEKRYKIVRKEATRKDRSGIQR
ncbi:hypothetical protein J4408_00470 [Candidatus Pacearchaeota archaeon]|nr:hypothetical protein [Candidatus Pacearchaeota archaeon]